MPFEYDISVLSYKVSELVGILVGRGEDGDISRALTVEAGQCAWRIANTIGPRKKESGEQAVARDVKKYVTTYPTYTNVKPESSYAGFAWLSAGPEYLVGIGNDDNISDATVSGVIERYYQERKKPLRGLATVRLGKRGKQAILRVNRVRANPGAYAGAVKSIQSRVGQSKASWARTAVELLPNKRVPAWVLNQIAQVVSNGKSILDTKGMDFPTSPELEFGSRAKGVESNPFMRSRIQQAISVTEKALQSKLNKVVAGQAYNWNTGQVFLPTVFEDN